LVGENAGFDYKAAIAKGWRDSAYAVIPTAVKDALHHKA
jgi:hypothetical protein